MQDNELETLNWKAIFHLEEFLIHSSNTIIHWDMVCDLRDGGEIRVDDRLLYKNGEFVIEF